MMKFSFLTFLVFCVFAAAAQEKVDSLTYNQQLLQYKSPENRGVRRAPLTLPFVDDFSYELRVPDPSKWMTDQTYVNSTFPIKPPSIGVATFDGLNASGQPYSSSNSAYGSADTLMSMEIDLSPYTAADSVYFSFYYQVSGYGNPPELRDSIVLEFKINDTVWQKMWEDLSLPSLEPDSFYLIYIPVLNPKWHRSDFQFRFRNYASLTGNVDHWHIDYIVLDKGRTFTDSILNDVAFYQNGRPLLKNYSSMPLNHFKGFESTELADSLFVFATNHFNVVKNTTFSYDASENCNSTQVAADFFQTINFNPLSSTRLSEQNYKNEITTLVNSISCDSLVISTRYFLQNSPPDPTTAFNDTVVHKQRFYNYFAYDDGSAEVAYAVQGAGGQFAYRFVSNVPDTLRAIRVHFAHIDGDFSNKLINLIVWKSLDFPSGEKDSIIYRKDLIKPVYTDSVNGFHTYHLDSSFVVMDTFFVGFQQQDSDNFRIGMDRNSVAKSHLFFYVLGSWKTSEFDGALMVRPVMGRQLPGVGINRLTSTVKKLDVYPNPADDVIYWNPDRMLTGAMYTVYDIYGRTVQTGYIDDNAIGIQYLQKGIYILHIEDRESNLHYSSKFVKID